MDIITTIIPQLSAGICGSEGQTTRCWGILCSLVQGTKHSQNVVNSFAYSYIHDLKLDVL
jgi:hypothetical protein